MQRMAIAIFLACACVGGVCSSNGIQFDDSYSQIDEELDDEVLIFHIVSTGDAAWSSMASHLAADSWPDYNVADHPRSTEF